MSDWPCPTLLTHAVWVESQYGSTVVRLFCCGLDLIEPPQSDVAVLHASGLSEDDFNKGVRISNVSFVIPCGHVTRIAPGPEIDVTAGEIEHRMNLTKGASDPPERGMSLAAIRTTLAELREPSEDH